ncbi:WxL domain-containing protein [Enterococcus casseliflavus]|uniref:WxL domain-containing protein n=1 Tax=Enterococcus casseliflavus TaxID=37734 RepID=UPI002DB96C80|nr:WxL domain-containing protein [Enterococcus casseliflavus]MEB8419030.1 WxL domain-containing protein [Enterococcus casseliflavus]
MKRTSMLASIAIILTSLLSSGGVYAAEQTQKADPATAKTPVTADLTTPNTPTPKPPSDPNNPTKTENEQGTVNGESGKLGIAYYPKGFSFTGNLGDSKLTLKDSGSNTGSDKVTYNIGVKDNTRQHNHWILTANLNWNVGYELPGATITIANPDNGKVKLNKNNGVTDFSADDLVVQSDVQGTTSSSVTINNTQTTIMTKDTGTVGKGTYDYSLGSVGSLTLTIPNATDLVAKQYGGNVNWNLQISPDTSNSITN